MFFEFKGLKTTLFWFNCSFFLDNLFCPCLEFTECFEFEGIYTRPTDSTDLQRPWSSPWRGTTMSPWAARCHLSFWWIPHFGTSCKNNAPCIDYDTTQQHLAVSHQLIRPSSQTCHVYLHHARRCLLLLTFIVLAISEWGTRDEVDEPPGMQVLRSILTQ